MHTTTEVNPVIEKTKELCQAILEQPAFQSLRQRVDNFMNDEPTKAQFQSLNEKGEFLHHKQQQGLPLSNEEIADFEKDRQALLTNSTAVDFLNAQEEIRNMQQSVNQYVAKTFELGRLPTEDDFNQGGCGSGCGCHH